MEEILETVKAVDALYQSGLRRSEVSHPSIVAAYRGPDQSAYLGK